LINCAQALASNATANREKHKPNLISAKPPDRPVLDNPPPLKSDARHQARLYLSGDRCSRHADHRCDDAISEPNLRRWDAVQSRVDFTHIVRIVIRDLINLGMIDRNLLQPRVEHSAGARHNLAHKGWEIAQTFGVFGAENDPKVPAVSLSPLRQTCSANKGFVLRIV
jgi:hypothetical protein